MHFFIDHTKLVQQQSEDQYGPDTTNAAAKYNVTSRFTLTESAKAFACQSGKMIVQRNDTSPSSLVNLIIKPLDVTKVKGISVKYYVYRGIKLDSFFTNNNINDKNTPGISEFLKSFWDNYSKELAANPNSSPPIPLDLGYGANNLAPDQSGVYSPDSFNEDRPIEDIFLKKTIAKSVLVTEGMWIGDFERDVKIGFEIVLVTDIKIKTNLKLFRSSLRSIEIGNGSSLEEKATKDQILAFIDPSAFFGAHYKVGVKTFDVTSPRKIPGSLYTHLISKFTTRNRIYLDVRSEKGLSYNFYENYKIGDLDLRNIRLNGANETNAQPYETNGWPVIFFDEIRNQDNNNRKNVVSFRLRINGNTEPVLYINDKDYSHTVDFAPLPNQANATDTNVNRKNFFIETAIKEEGSNNPETNNWTKEIKLYFPHIGSDAIPATSSTPGSPGNSNVANHLKVFYFIGQAVTSGTDRLLNAKYYDSAFCSIDFDGLGDPEVKNEYVENPNPIYVQEPLIVQQRQVNGNPVAPQVDDGAGNFSFTAESGAFWDNQKVLFYCKKLKKRKEGDGSGKFYLNTYRKKLIIQNAQYDALFKNKFDTICRAYSQTEGSIRIIGLNYYKEQNVVQEKENLMLLGITPNELRALKDIRRDALSPHHPCYIFLRADSNNPLKDSSAQRHRYRRYDVLLQGLNNDGDPARADTSLIVYSRDNTFFSSQAFSNLEDHSACPNNVEFHIYHDGIVKVNDNIDFSLLRKARVISQFETGIEPSIDPNDSEEQKIKYKYFPPPVAGTPQVETEIFSNSDSFSVVMSDEMRLDGTDQVADYTSFITYTGDNVDAQESYRNDDRDILTRGKAGNKRYVNDGRKVFMIHFIDPTQNGVVLANNADSEVFTTTNNTLGMKFTYVQTRRYFARPDVAAAFIGALIQFCPTLPAASIVKSTGFSFGDGSCYPSQEHVNGEAGDMVYHGGNYTSKKTGTPPAIDYVVDQPDPGTAITNARDRDFILRLNDYGFSKFRVGRHKTGLKTLLDAQSVLNTKIKQDSSNPDPEKATLHDNHLHVTNCYIKENIEKNLPECQ